MKIIFILQLHFYTHWLFACANYVFFIRIAHTHRPLPSNTSWNKSSTQQFQQNCTWRNNRKEYFPDDEDNRCKQNNIIWNSRARHKLFRRFYHIFAELQDTCSMAHIQKHLQITNSNDKLMTSKDVQSEGDVRALEMR